MIARTARRLVYLFIRRLLQLYERLGAQTSSTLRILLTLIRRLASLVHLHTSSNDSCSRLSSDSSKGTEDGSTAIYTSCQPPSSTRVVERRATLSPDDVPDKALAIAPGMTRLATAATGGLELLTEEEDGITSCVFNVLDDPADPSSLHQTRGHSRKPSASSNTETTESTLNNDSPNRSPDIRSVASLHFDADGHPQVGDEPAEFISSAANPASSAASPESLKIVTTSPSKLKHYDHDIVIPESTPDCDWQINTLMSHTEFSKTKRLGWASFIHPEGQPYYQQHREGILYTTEADICDDCVYKKIKDFMAEMHERISKSKLRYVNGVEVVLEIEGKGEEWAYYIICHETMHLLWLEKHDATYLVTTVAGGVPSFKHIKHCLDGEYFLHLFYFPHDRKLPSDFFDNLIGVLSWGLTDTMTSLNSHTPYGHKELDRFLHIMQIMKEMKGKPEEYAVCVGSRLMHIICLERFYNFHGHHGARLTSEQSVRGKQPKRLSGIFRLLSLLLFDVPFKRLDMLDKVYVDKRVQRIQLDLISEHLVDSWQQEVINAAVLIAANVGFLDLDGVLSSGNVSIGAVASLVSVIMTLCCIIIGLLLTKRVRNYKTQDIGVMAEILDKWHSEDRGLLSLAVMYSLPYALLVWGAVTFVFAIACLSFAGRPRSPQMYVLAVTFVLALAVCAWTVFEIDSWTTLGAKLFPCLYRCADASGQTDDSEATNQPSARVYKPRLVERISNSLRLKNLPADFVSSPLRSPQRTDSTEMRRLA